MFYTNTNYERRGHYLNPLFPEDRAMQHRRQEDWVKIVSQNGMEYEPGDEDKRRFWYRDAMRYLRRKLRTEGMIWFPEGHLFCKVWFESHKKGSETL